MALVVSGMNNVLNSQDTRRLDTGTKFQAGHGPHGSHRHRLQLAGRLWFAKPKTGSKLLPILPLIVSIAFMLIADIDSPRHGVIRVRPQNLISLAESLRPPAGIP